ncbi:phage tail-collar fiber domain-containing protein [Aeromonas caviae]|uniref:phage tail-collar fiber domain-containing protein n=1 Tax=Aeromonas caviae TaxID=648 RepID=UPI002B466D91|nr:phage tail protein [Aeromonas caviae]
MSQVITNAFEQYWQSSLAAEQPVVLDEFILADIPNLDITSPIDPDAGLPPESQIVHRQNVDQRGRINNNAVAYTIVMDTTVGDFSFNAMYLRNKQNGVIGMIVYKGRETKLKTDQTTGQTGNSLVKSMLMGYDQAAEATLTNVDAGTWQIDYAARLRGMDEDIRQLQADLYGHHTFVGDGFKVVETDGAFQVTPGVAIVGGLRVELKQPEVIYPGTKPIGVWVDVHRAGSLLSEHQNHFTIITSVADLADHLDGNGFQHYVAKLGTVQGDGAIVDNRVIPSGEVGSINETLQKKKNLSDLDNIRAALVNLGLENVEIESWEAFRRSYAELGFVLRDRPESFGNGGILTSARDILLDEYSGKVFSHPGPYPIDVDKGTNPSSGGFIDRSYTSSGVVYLESFGYGALGNTPEQNYASLQFFYEWLGTQSHIGKVIHPPRKVDIKTTVTPNSTKFLGSDIVSIPSFVFDFNGGQMNDVTEISNGNDIHVLFVLRNASIISFINSDINGSMLEPTTVRGGMILCRAYNCSYVSFIGKASKLISHVEPRGCGTVNIDAECDTVRYPFVVYYCKVFNVKLNAKKCWRDYFIQGAESGSFNIVSDAPRQHSMIKAYDSNMVNSNITGFYKARNRSYGLDTPTGQFGFEIESDSPVTFRNIHITVDIEGNYGRPIMMRNFKSDGRNQDGAMGHILQNIKISGRIRDLSGSTGNLFLVGGGYRAGDYIQSMALDDLTVNGSFIVNIGEIIPAIDVASKMKWRNLTITDGYLETHSTGFYADFIDAHEVTFVGKAYASNSKNSLGCLEFYKRKVGNIATGIPLFSLDNTKTMNHIVIDYCATATETSFNPFIEGRISGLVVYPTSAVISDTTVDTQYAKQGVAGVVDLFEISPGVLGIKIPTWPLESAMIQVKVMVKYHSYGEGDFSSVAGLVYAPYKPL